MKTETHTKTVKASAPEKSERRNDRADIAVAKATILGACKPNVVRFEHAHVTPQFVYLEIKIARFAK